MPNDHMQASYRNCLEIQANFARGYSPLTAAMLEQLLRWSGDPAGSGEGFGDRASMEVFCLKLAGFFEEEGCDSALAWSIHLRSSLRLGACIHAYVLEDDPRVASLRPYFASVGGSRSVEDASFPADLFHAAIALGDDFFERARSWRIQNNESSRGLAWLFPVAVVGADAINLVELGASAGLNLYAEQRAFDLQWGEGEAGGGGGETVRLGQADGPQFQVRAKGERVPEIPAGDRLGPEVLRRLGCDIHPIDIDLPEKKLGLEACIWGDQSSRLTRLREAFEVHQRIRGEEGVLAEVREATLPEDLPGFLDEVLPRYPKAPVVVFNTYLSAFMKDVDHRFMERTMGEYAHEWCLQHRLPWMWVRLEPARRGETVASRHTGWCRWVVELWGGAHHERIELGWAHPHFVEVEFGPGLAQLYALRNER